MPELDRFQILHGTDQKQFDQARMELEAEFNESNANDFLHTYSLKPLSFLLKNSRAIFSEPYFGFGFYKNMMLHGFVNPLSYTEEIKKLNTYLEEAIKGGAPKNQTSRVGDFIATLNGMCERDQYLIIALKRGRQNMGLDGSFFREIFGTVYEAERDNDNELLTQAVHILFSHKDPFVYIPVGYMICKRHPEYMYLLADATKRERVSITTSSDDAYIKRALAIKECIQILANSKDIICTIKKNPNLYYLWASYSKHFMEEIPCEKEPDMIPVPSPGLNAIESVERIYEEVEDQFGINECLCTRYDNLSTKKSFYEYYQESLEATEEITGEDCSVKLEEVEDIICALEGELSYMEWEDDGEPNAVIKSHIMTRKERAAEEKEKEKNEKSFLSKSDEGDSLVGETIPEVEAIKMVSEAIVKAEDLSTSAESKDAFLKEMNAALSELTKTLHAEIVKYPTVKQKIVELRKAIDDGTEMFESCNKSVYEAGEEENQDGEEEKTDGEDMEEPISKASKPKTDLATKIQNKALDHEAKVSEKDAVRGEKLQKLKNAANAVAQRPKKIKEDLSKFVQNFQKMDDNKRKEFFIKPGYRHKIFKKCRVALTYGAIAQVNLAYIPMFAMIRHFSKQKDKRIRNELAMELDSEIRICEEKINDANSQGDNKTKYELMRIRDRLTAEKTRVRINSKYI